MAVSVHVSFPSRPRLTSPISVRLQSLSTLIHVFNDIRSKTQPSSATSSPACPPARKSHRSCVRTKASGTTVPRPRKRHPG